MGYFLYFLLFCQVFGGIFKLFRKLEFHRVTFQNHGLSVGKLPSYDFYDVGGKHAKHLYFFCSFTEIFLSNNLQKQTPFFLLNSLFTDGWTDENPAYRKNPATRGGRGPPNFFSQMNAHLIQSDSWVTHFGQS